MYQLEKMNYKDENPINTINKIRTILGNLNILTKEENWKNSTKGFYSVTVRIVGTDICSNGKGTNSKYALASAYGELMERLQNMTYFRFSYDMNENDLHYGDFLYSPDEKNFTIAELEKNNEWLEFYKKNCSSKFYEVIEMWKQVSYEKIDNDFIAIPYYNSISGNPSYIPIKMACKMYMSNGMCAGNTKEEALVQGICEIFERKVNKEVILNKLNPPIIPNDYLKKYKSVYNKIKRIESFGSYKIIIKDCSLKMNLPVVSVILLDYVKGKYFVKFGSHPVFEIALDRTLNELLQGQEINNMLGMSEYLYNNEVKNVKENMLSILENGCGFYPDEFFNTNYSYEFNGIKDMKFVSNKSILNYLFKLIEELGFTSFIRDVSFLGFPSYHIVIPGLSDIDDFYDVQSLLNFGEYNKIKKFIRAEKDLSKEKIIMLIVALNGYNLQSNGSIISLLNIPVNGNLPWYYTNLSLYKACLFYEVGDYYKAGLEIENFLSFMYEMGFNREDNSFFRCLRDCLFMKKDKISSRECRLRLNLFYPNNIVDSIITIVNEKKSLLGCAGSIDCFNCENCSFKNHCKQSKMSSIYKIIKSEMLKKTINN